jgi:hypothetical protein
MRLAARRVVDQAFFLSFGKHVGADSVDAETASATAFSRQR